MKKVYLIFCLLLAIVFTNRLQAQTPPTFTSTAVTTVNGNETYTYGITTTDAEGNVITLTAPTLPSWLTLTTTTQVSTFAGSTSGFADGTGAAAKFSLPYGVGIDDSGTIYVADLINNRIRKITPAGVVTTLAGSGTASFADGTGASASFNSPVSVAIDVSGNVYVGDNGNQRIRKITPAGVVTTLAGSGVAGFANGTGTAAQFSSPSGVCVDDSGNVYVADRDNHVIRKITPAGVVTTFAGSGVAGYNDATGTAAQFNAPFGMTIDASGNIYVGDSSNSRIRKITPAGVVTTLAGSGTFGFADDTGASAQFSSPKGVDVDALGNVYVADFGNHKIRKITPAGVVTTLAGSTAGYLDGLGSTAKFNGLFGVAVDPAGIVFVADYNNNRIRKMIPAGVLSGDATGQVGDYPVVINAADDDGNTDQTFTINVSNVFTAATGNWNTGGNWSATSIPTSTVNTVIPLGNSATLDITNGAVNNFTNHGTLTIDSGKGLTISGNLSNDGTFTIDSDATTSGSLIVDGTSTGNVIYNRYMSIDKWHLISAPVGGQNIENFVTFAANNVATNGVDYGLAPYDNTLTIGVSTWDHWTSDGTNPVSGAGNFIAGKGYEIRTTTTVGTVAFTGTVPVSQVAIAVTGTSNRWNLVGNPYPSSIPANSNADATNNFLTVNSAALDPSFVALYIWNPSTSLYEVVNQAASSRFIAPVQGFFIKAVSGEAGVVNFTTAMRTNQAAVLFQKAATPNAPSIVLSADNNAGKISTTTIKYMGGMSLGLDLGYDAGCFGAAGKSGFGLYTHLVEDNGVDFAIQAVPDNTYDTTIIPIGLDADLGMQVTFKADVTNLPLVKKVFLEDRLLNIFTEINNTDKTYALTLNTQSSGIGRFFLHTQDNASTLAVTDFNTLKLSVIALPLSNSINVIGRVEQPASLNIYDILGRFVFTTKLKATNNNEVAIPPLADGIYIIKIKTAKSNFSTKIAWY